MSLVKGQKEPVVQGWLPDSSAGYGGVRPIPTAAYRKHAQGRTTMLYALCPSATSAPCPVKDVQFADTTLKVLFADGTEKVIRFQTEPGK